MRMIEGRGNATLNKYFILDDPGSPTIKTSITALVSLWEWTKQAGQARIRDSDRSLFLSISSQQPWPMPYNGILWCIWLFII